MFAGGAGARASIVSMMAMAVIASSIAYAEPYPLESLVTIPITAEVIGTEQVINCVMTAEGLPEGCEILEPASGEEDEKSIHYIIGGSSNYTVDVLLAEK